MTRMLCMAVVLLLVGCGGRGSQYVGKWRTVTPDASVLRLDLRADHTTSLIYASREKLPGVPDIIVSGTWEPEAEGVRLHLDRTEGGAADRFPVAEHLRSIRDGKGLADGPLEYERE